MSETRDDLREALARFYHPTAFDPPDYAMRGRGIQGRLVMYRRRAYEFADRFLAGPLAPILAQVSVLQAEVEEAERIRKGHALELQDAQQAAGQVLGYPWFKDDQENFPGSTEADGVCIGDHAGSTIVHELASAYAKVRAEVERLQKVEGERDEARSALEAVGALATEWCQGRAYRSSGGEDARDGYARGATSVAGEVRRLIWDRDPEFHNRIAARQAPSNPMQEVIAETVERAGRDPAQAFLRETLARRDAERQASNPSLTKTKEGSDAR